MKKRPGKVPEGCDENGRICNECNVYKKWKHYRKSQAKNSATGKQARCTVCVNKAQVKRRVDAKEAASVSLLDTPINYWLMRLWT